MNTAVEEAKAEFLRAKDRLTKSLDSTPDDKINWSPSATCRTPIELVAHSALSIQGMQSWLDGQPFPFSSMEELDDFSRKKEMEFTTREQVKQLLDQNTNSFLAWLDSLSPEKVASTFESPMGAFPMAAAITFPADHLRAHAAQLEYLQTIYGDRTMHM
jgi:hypothetical protein